MCWRRFDWCALPVSQIYHTTSAGRVSIDPSMSSSRSVWLLKAIEFGDERVFQCASLCSSDKCNVHGVKAIPVTGRVNHICNAGDITEFRAHRSLLLWFMMNEFCHCSLNSHRFLRNSSWEANTHSVGSPTGPSTIRQHQRLSTIVTSSHLHHFSTSKCFTKNKIKFSKSAPLERSLQCAATIQSQLNQLVVPRSINGVNSLNGIILENDEYNWVMSDCETSIQLRRLLRLAEDELDCTGNSSDLISLYLRAMESTDCLKCLENWMAITRWMSICRTTGRWWFRQYQLILTVLSDWRRVVCGLFNWPNGRYRLFLDWMAVVEVAEVRRWLKVPVQSLCVSEALHLNDNSNNSLVLQVTQKPHQTPPIHHFQRNYAKWISFVEFASSSCHSHLLAHSMSTSFITKTMLACHSAKWKPKQT